MIAMLDRWLPTIQAHHPARNRQPPVAARLRRITAGSVWIGHHRGDVQNVAAKANGESRTNRPGLADRPHGNHRTGSPQVPARQEFLRLPGILNR